MTWELMHEGYEPITSLDGLTCETVVGHVNGMPQTCGNPATGRHIYASIDHAYDTPVCDEHPAAVAVDGDIVKHSVNLYMWLCARCGESRFLRSLQAARRDKEAHTKSKFHGDDIRWVFSEKKFRKRIMQGVSMADLYGRYGPYRKALDGRPLLHNGKAPRV